MEDLSKPRNDAPVSFEYHRRPDAQEDFLGGTMLVLQSKKRGLIFVRTLGTR